MTQPRRKDAGPPVDVEIGAAVRAKELRFRRRPEVEVRFETEPDGESGSLSERENLPDTVEPGVTYRDVRVRWYGAARIVTEDKPGR